MKVLLAFLAAALPFALLQFALIPMLERRCRADRQRSVIERAAVLSMFYVGRSVTSMALLITGATGLLVLGLNFWPIGDDAATMRALAGFLDPWRSRLLNVPMMPFVLLSGLMSLVLAVAAYGATRKRVREIFELNAEQETERLRRERERGEWPELPPTREMKKIDGVLAETLRVLDRVETLGLPPDARAEQVRKLEDRSAELIQERDRLDFLRRLTVTVEPDAMIVPPPRSVLERLLPLWLRRGPLSALRTKRRLILTFTLLIIAPAIMLVVLRPLGAALDARIVDLNGQQILVRERKALEELRKQGGGAEPGETWGESDELIANRLSREFEQAFGRFLLGPSIRTVQEALVRERLLLGFALVGSGRPIVVRSTFEGATDLRPIEAEASQLQLEARDRAGPATALGARLKKDAREQMLKEPSAWRHIREAIEANDLTLSDEATGAQIGPLAAAEVFGAAMGANRQLGPELKRVAESLGKDIGPKALEQVYLLKASAFKTALVLGHPLSAAVEEVAGPLVLLRDAVYAPLEPTLATLPKADAIPRAIVNHPAAITTQSSGESADPARLKGALDRLATAAGYAEKDVGLLELAAPLATLADWAPGQRGLDQRTPRARILSEWRATFIDPGVTTRARDALRFQGFGPATGLIAGARPADFSGKPRVADLEWTTRRDRISLRVKTEAEVVELGSFRQGLVWLALAYAADGRAPVLLSSPATIIGGQKRLIHAAIDETTFACRTAAVFTELETRLKAEAAHPALLDAEVQAATFNVAWALRARLIEQSHALRSKDEDAAKHPRWVRAEAETRLIDPALRASLAMALKDPDRIKGKSSSLLRKLPNHFEPSLTDTVEGCATAGDVAGFEECVIRGSRRWLGEIESGGGENWWRPPPRVRTRLSVLEAPYVADAGLKYLTRPSDGDYEALLKVLRFRVDIAASTPATKASVEEDTLFAQASVEIPALSRSLTDAAREVMITDPFRRTVVTDTVEFILLQRLFRQLLEGTLGPGFDLGRLLELEDVVATRRPPAASVPRWDPVEPAAERQLAVLLGAAATEIERRPGEKPDWVQAALAPMKTCRLQLEKLSDAELVELDGASFDDRCRTIPEPPQYPSGPYAEVAPLVRAMARRADVIREARGLRRLLLAEHAVAPLSLGICPRF